jgi:hypothetical protein
MADPYSGVSITGYNSNPPADDGSQTEANRVKWATIKTKITDPVKTRTDDMDTALISAFGKIDGGVTSTSINYTVLSTDQGKLVRATASGITITTPDATDVDAPFVFGFLNDSTSDITLDGSGSQTIDGEASIIVPAGAGGRIRTDGSNWFTEGQNSQRTQITPQGYLTLLDTATYLTHVVPNSDQASKTAVYYRPYKGNLVPIPNGTLFSVREFSELTLTLNSNHVANGIYDVFVFDDSGTIRIGTGPVWTTVTAAAGARGTGAGTTELNLLKGLLVNNVAATMRNGGTTYSVAAKSGVYVGSILIDGSAGQITCHTSYGQSRKWGVWNAYNREQVFMKAGDGTASWISNNASGVHAANANSANSITIFVGVPGVFVDLKYSSRASATLNTNNELVTSVGIGYNSTSSYSGKTANYSHTVQTVSNAVTADASLNGANFLTTPTIGINVVTALEVSNGSDVNVSFHGTEASMLLSAGYPA